MAENFSDWPSLKLSDEIASCERYETPDVLSLAELPPVIGTNTSRDWFSKIPRDRAAVVCGRPATPSVAQEQNQDAGTPAHVGVDTHALSRQR